MTMVGLIGQQVTHSYSKAIHEQLSGLPYHLLSLSFQELEQFLKDRAFTGVNITMPYKEKVIPYLDTLDTTARTTNAVNTIVVRDGKLHGYNTDAFGFEFLLNTYNISCSNKKCLLLGNGATSRTIQYVLKQQGASKIWVASRTKTKDTISYLTLEDAVDAEVIINTTPVGMYPFMDDLVMSLEEFAQLSLVIDVIYNPFRTRLMLEAGNKGIPSIGGLAMLVAQAVKANELFYPLHHRLDLVGNIYQQMKREKQNIVLIGLPASGKTTLGKMFAIKTKREFIDLDQYITSMEGKSINFLFKQYGESYFRTLEHHYAMKLANEFGVVIATGGGIIKNDRTMAALKANGCIVYVTRDLDKMILKENVRPLIQSRADLIHLAAERAHQYTHYADITIDNNTTLEDSIEQLEKAINNDQKMRILR